MWFTQLGVCARTATRSRLGEWALPLALGALGLLLLFVYHWVLTPPAWWGYLLPFWLVYFAAGMVLAVASATDWAPARRVAAHGGWCVIVALAAYAVMCADDYLDIYGVAHPAWVNPLVDQLAQIVVAVGLLLPAVWDDGRRAGLRAIAGSAPVLYLGLISYGIFLYHGTAFQLVDDIGIDPWGFQVGALAGLAMTIVLAALSWRLIERPVQSLRRLVGDRVGAAAESVHLLGAAEPADIFGAAEGKQPVSRLVG